MAVPPDYDADPERFRLASRVTETHLTGGMSLYARLVPLLGAGRVLDVGCGDGALGREVRRSGSAARVVGLDSSATMLRDHPPPAVRGDAVRLPFRDGAFDAVVAVNMLYHLEDPGAALREARRVLRPNGLFVASAIARDDSPELAHVWRRAPTTFDAEEAPGLVGAVFGAVEVERWDAPLLVLPHRDAVRDFLLARQVPRAEAVARAERVGVPVRLTKRGALVLARRS